jgi:hypothetical protein
VAAAPWRGQALRKNGKEESEEGSISVPRWKLRQEARTSEWEAKWDAGPELKQHRPAASTRTGKLLQPSQCSRFLLLLMSTNAVLWQTRRHLWWKRWAREKQQTRGWLLLVATRGCARSQAGAEATLVERLQHVVAAKRRGTEAAKTRGTEVSLSSMHMGCCFRKCRDWMGRRPFSGLETFGAVGESTVSEKHVAEERARFHVGGGGEGGRQVNLVFRPRRLCCAFLRGCCGVFGVSISAGVYPEEARAGCGPTWVLHDEPKQRERGALGGA